MANVVVAMYRSADTTMVCHLAGQSQCHTQPVRHRYNVGFKHSILKTLSVLSTNRGQKAPFKNLVHNGVDFYVQNALILTYEHL